MSPIVNREPFSNSSPPRWNRRIICSLGARVLVAVLIGACGSLTSCSHEARRYWSYGRQDNGSLALIPTTVDDALLDYGLCDVALGHIGFWLENYLTPDGQIKYYTWAPSVVDGVGDIGRLASLYLKARRVCGGSADGQAWGKRYEPVMRALGARLLTLKAAGTDGRVPARGPPRPECAGLVAGSPEADWSHFSPSVSPDNETWYGVNLWLQRGMAEIGRFLPEDDALGEQLRGNASVFADEIAASIEKSMVPANTSGFVHPPFLPPYARARGEFVVSWILNAAPALAHHTCHAPRHPVHAARWASCRVLTDSMPK